HCRGATSGERNRRQCMGALLPGSGGEAPEPYRRCRSRGRARARAYAAGCAETPWPSATTTSGRYSRIGRGSTDRSVARSRQTFAAPPLPLRVRPVRLRDWHRKPSASRGSPRTCCVDALECPPDHLWGYATEDARSTDPVGQYKMRNAADRLLVM